MNIKHLPTTELTLHPSCKALPKVDPESHEYKALLSTIAEVGMPRLVAVSDYRVVDGRDVWEAAKQLGIKTVPCVEVPKEDVPFWMAADLATRTHYSKGQRAYLLYPLLEPMIVAAKKRKIANLKRGGNPTEKGGQSAQVVENPDSALSALSMASRLTEAKTIEEAADVLGVSRRLLFFAAKIHREFEAEPALRELFEPSIMEQDEDGATTGLGAIVAGIAGRKASKGVTPTIQPELELWTDRVSKLFSPQKWNAWDKVAPDVRQAVAERAAKELFSTAPEEVLAAIEIAAARRLGVKVPLRAVS